MTLRCKKGKDKMNVHVIVDFMHIYYKYFFQKQRGNLKYLSAEVEKDGKTVSRETTLIYCPLRDIESIRARMETLGHDVTVSVCFDEKSVRKNSGVEGAEQYKEGRKNSLTEIDFENINLIYEMLEKAGHNVYRVEGYEADDLVNHLCRKYTDKFDYTVIYTNDKDLLVNINDKVGVMRYHIYSGYGQVDKNNYEEYLSREFGAKIPYNAIGLYLASVGDSADKIKGIERFGKVAFEKLLNKVIDKYNPDFESCGDYDKLKEVVYDCKEFLTDTQFKQLTASFELVKNVDIEDSLVKAPTSKCTAEKRRDAYSGMKMESLI